jgi:hypothetical protein
VHNIWERAEARDQMLGVPATRSSASRGVRSRGAVVSHGSQAAA